MAIPRRPLQCLRPGGSYDANGRWQESSGAPFTITASVQPLSGKELEKLPEGRNLSGVYRLYTDFRLQTVDDNGAKNPDRIVAGISPTPNRQYEVIQVEEWQNGVVPHYKAIVSLMDQPADGAA